VSVAGCCQQEDDEGKFCHEALQTVSKEGCRVSIDDLACPESTSFRKKAKKVKKADFFFASERIARRWGGGIIGIGVLDGRDAMTPSTYSDDARVRAFPDTTVEQANP
jgi:hypothetical protein